MSGSLFGNLPTEAIHALSAVSSELKFAAGQSVFREGDPGNGIYWVKEGQIAISCAVGTSGPLVLTRVFPGDFFGEMAVLDQLPRSANAVAESESVLWFIPRAEVQEVLRRVPELGSLFLQRFSGRMRDFNRQYIDQALQADRIAMVGRLATSVVHDLKTPLTIINLSTELAVRENATMECRRAAQKSVNDQVDRITNLVNDLLDYARGNPVAIDLALVDYGAFLTSVLDDLQSCAARARVELRLEAGPANVSVKLDQRRMYRVFYNILKNSLDAMPNGGVVTVCFQVREAQVVTEITDTGPGLAPQIMDRLFEPFATFGKRLGTGLGLSICRRIVQEHNGTITAGNRPGGGAVFTLTLPCP